MKKLWLLLFVSSLAWGAYSPGVFIADPSTPTQRAAVDASGNLSCKLPAGSNIIGKVSIDQTTPGTTNGVQVNAALPAGTNILGKFGIDQTTPGTTNGVQVNAALPAGTNVIGKVSIDQTTPGTTNRVQSNVDQIGGTSLSLGQKTMVNSIPVTIASDQVQGKTYGNANAAFSQTSVTTTASTISAPANAVRVMIQGDSSNTDCIRYRFDGTAATSTVGLVAQAGQDSGLLETSMSVSVASCSGTQKVNVQYFAQ